MFGRTLVVIALAGFAQSALAHAPRRQLDAHEHGAGRLAVAIEGKRVEMELEVPANDIVGFEHAPTTAKQHEALEDAKRRLGRLEGIVAFTQQAGCALSSVNVELAGAIAGTKEAHDHGEKAMKPKEKDHDHEHGAHSEIRVTYAVQCSAPDKLASLSFDYFKAFQRAQKLDVTVIGPKGQSGYVVTREKPVLDISGLS